MLYSFSHECCSFVPWIHPNPYLINASWYGSEIRVISNHEDFTAHNTLHLVTGVHIDPGTLKPIMEASYIVYYCKVESAEIIECGIERTGSEGEDDTSGHHERHRSWSWWYYWNWNGTSAKQTWMAVSFFPARTVHPIPPAKNGQQHLAVCM